MARVDETDTWWRARPSVLHYWQRWAVVAVCGGAGWAARQPEWFGAAAAEYAPWLWGVAGAIGAWTALELLCGGQAWATRERIVQSRGVVSRHTSELSIARVEDVDVRQNAIERALGIGRVRVRSGDEGTRQITLPGVRDPEEVAEAIRGARDDSDPKPE